MSQTMNEGGSAAKPSKKFAMINCTCCDRKIPGKIVSWPNQPNAYTEKDEIPMWRPCKECGVWLSHLEEDDPGLKGRCFECHKENLL